MMLKTAVVLSCLAGLVGSATAQNDVPVLGGLSPNVVPPMTDLDSLWDQSQFDPNLVAVVDTQFPDFPTYSTYMVDDFNTGEDRWNIESVSTYFTIGFGFWDPSQILTGTLQFFPKSGSLPDNGSDLVPEYKVGIRVTDGGGYWIVNAETIDIPELQGVNGEYWIGLTPDVSFGGFGQEFHFQLPLSYRDEAAARNPGGAFGFGPDWIGVSSFGFGASDMAFKLEGSIGGGGDCYADFNDDDLLDLFDFLAFVNAFNALDPVADCDEDGEFTLFDFLCFTNSFNAGC